MSELNRKRKKRKRNFESTLQIKFLQKDLELNELLLVKERLHFQMLSQASELEKKRDVRSYII